MDADLLAIAAEVSPPLAEASEDPRALAGYIAGIATAEKDKLLGLVARGQAARAKKDLLRGFRGRAAGQHPDPAPPRTVAQLLDTTAERRRQRKELGGPAGRASDLSQPERYEP